MQASNELKATQAELLCKVQQLGEAQHALHEAERANQASAVQVQCFALLSFRWSARNALHTGLAGGQEPCSSIQPACCPAATQTIVPALLPAATGPGGAAGGG